MLTGIEVSRSVQVEQWLERLRLEPWLIRSARTTERERSAALIRSMKIDMIVMKDIVIRIGIAVTLVVMGWATSLIVAAMMDITVKRLNRV